jgi:hypothetical protein
LSEVKGQVVEAIKGTITGMGIGRDEEKPQDSPLESTAVKGERMAVEKGVGTGARSAVKETVMGMVMVRDEEKPQDSPLESTAVKGEMIAVEKGAGTGAGADEEPQQIASKLYASASK